METSCRWLSGRRYAAGLASSRMTSTRHRLLIKRKIEIMKVVGYICRITDSGQILVKPLIKEVIARVFDLRGVVAEVFVHRAIVAELQHYVWLHASR